MRYADPASKATSAGRSRSAGARRQQPVTSPADVSKQLEALKKDGKKSVLLYVANAQGDMRYVAIAMD